MAQSTLGTRYAAYAPWLLSLLRMITGFVFLLSGSSKLFAFPAGMPPNGATVPLLSQLGIGGVLELFGGALILIGLCTRPVAFVLSGEMAVAYFQFHFPKSFWPTVNQGVPAVLDCFIFLYLSAAGAGPFSVDGLRRNKRS
ncbi:MAG: DoxX family protein [Pseudomonadota bacterium]